MSRKSKTEVETGVIDIHTHVLPGLDDGAASISVSFRMMRAAYRQGVRTIIATPHYVRQQWRTKPKQIQHLADKLTELADTSFPDLRIYTGQEIQYFDGMVEMLQEGKLLTLAGSRYVLTEFLPLSPWSQIQGAVRKLILAGYYPVLAHIERYKCLREPGRLDELQSEGAYLQMNYGSLTRLDKFWDLRGWADRKWCRKTLLAGYISFLGTDMHGVRHRPPNSSKALAWIRKKGGEELARQLSIVNPEKMVTGEKL